MKINSLILAVLMTACIIVSVEAEAGGETGMPVEVQAVTLHTLKENIRALGEVKASQDLKVSSQYSGRITNLNTRIGAYVKQNDVIACIRTKKAEALLSNGNSAIKDIKIFAPISGYVAENYISSGEIAVAGQPLLRIISPERTYIKMSIPGEYLSKVKKGTPLTVKGKGQEYQTAIDAVVPVADAATGTFQAIAPLKARELYPGVVCRVTIHVGRKTVPAISRTAILTREGKQIVFVVSAGKAERRVVKTGIRTDKLIEIEQGVKVGESVAVVGNYELSDGVMVEVKHQ
jgi:multidrug efflux pump subunit AcrA (membrane-fusion protein)